MFDPATTSLAIIVILVLFYPSYHYAKRKNLSIGWNLFFTAIFGPLWWIVVMLKKKKEYQVFKYKNKPIFV